MAERMEVGLEKTLLNGQGSPSNHGEEHFKAPKENIKELDELPVISNSVLNPWGSDTDTSHASQNNLILTLRQKEADNTEDYLSPNNGKRKLNDCKFVATKTNGVIDIQTVGSASSDGVPSKRNLRRISNSKESVLQNAIALKEKSLGIRDISFYKKSKSPKTNSDKLNRQVRMLSPKTISSEQRTPDQESFSSEKSSSCLDLADISNVSKITEYSDVSKNTEQSQYHQEIKMNGSYSCENYSENPSDVSFNKEYRTIRKKKRYFKGLSYSFGRKKYSRRRKQGHIYIEHSVNASSVQNINLQGATNISTEANGLARSLSFQDNYAKSSQATSVLTKRAIGMHNSESTSSGITMEAHEKNPPNTADIQNETAKPESSIISSIESKVAICLCQIQEKVYMKRNPETKYYCQAIDSIEGKLIGCYNAVDIVEDDIKLQRPSVKVTYQMFCKVHNHRLLIHNCCPTCGIFCTQGSFVVCNSRHMYHRKCELVVGNKTICPHCGQSSPPSDTRVSIAQERNPFFLPLQKSSKDEPSAKITFGGSTTQPSEDNRMAPPVMWPTNSLVLPSGKRISIEGLPSLLETEKLEKYLFGLLSCSSSSPAQRCTYRTLYQASRSGDIEKLMACLTSGLNPNHLFREFTMGSALHAASAGGHLILVHVLIQAGALLDQLDKEQNTALILAIQNGHNDVVKYLIKAGANITFKGKDGMTPLQLTAKLGNFEGCYYLLSNPRCPRKYINVTDDGGWTALVWAAEFGHLNVVKYLLSHGADPLIRDVEQNIALHWAAISGSVDVCENLLQFTSDINCTNLHGDTPLHICARQDHYACVLLFLAQGARTDIQNSAGLLAIDCCINKPSDSYNAIKLNIELKQMTATSREKTAKILTNDITRGHEVTPIQCINALDDEKEPTDFVYVTENCFTSHIRIDNTITSLKPCKCGDTCSTISCTCGKLSLSCWYTEDGILSPDFNYSDPPMIFECNSVCSCNKLTCKNRVVQHGITGRFQLFRTKSKGWGVITLRLIPKGTYVCEYIGEIISDTEADTREDDSYLFDLDNKDGETYCIDAFRYGNIARFINHSCIPNLLPVKVFINHHDMHFPRIAFFSNRDIQPNEELGFDYGEKFWIIKYKSFTCTCGAENCRYSETTIRQTLDNYNKKLQMEDS